MMRKIIFFMMMVFAVSAFADVFPVLTSSHSSQCIPKPQVPNDTVSDFCALFPASVASCAPIKPGATGPTKAYMNLIYTLMVAHYGSLKVACAASAVQNGSTPAACVSQWTCYRNGGTSSDPSEPGQCSGTGHAC